MKKRWFVTVLFALTLCVCSAPALAAVESGGVKYLWYTQDGEQTWGENGQVIAFSGEQFFLSADSGVTYASIPEFQAASRQGWTDYDVRVTPLDNGGLRVEARSTFGEAGAPYTQRWDYTAGQLSQLLAKAEPNPVRVLADNGSVQVGVRTIQDYKNGDEALAPNVSAWRQQSWEEELVWSADGEHWSRCQYPQDFDCSYSMTGWWDGAFYLRKYDYTPDGYTSLDGVNWTYLAELPISSELCLTADWGKYHFEVVKPRDDPNDWYNEVYLMEGKERDKGVLLPHMGEGIRAQGIGVNSLTAHSGPNDTVILTASGNDGSFSLDYPVSSLDWCLENLSNSFRWTTQPAAEASNGEGIFLAKVAEHYRNGNTYEMEGELIRYDSTGWQKVENTPFSCVFRLLPYNGKTFLVEDNATGRHRLYASEDGLSWTEITALRPQDMKGSVRDYVNYAMTWTGSGYLACREAGNYGNRAGGTLYGGNTGVYLLDESFALTGSYDFGRNVQAVGFRDGVCYAQVSDSEGTKFRGVYHVGYDENGKEVYDTDPGYYNQYAPATLYRSADGKSWEPLGEEYQLSEEDLVSGGLANTYCRASGLPEPRQGGLPLHSVAVLDDWRFVLSTDNEVYLCKENTVWWVQLPHIGEAVRANAVTLGELTAAYTPEGNVEVKVIDRDSPSRSASVSYPPNSLNWVKENLDGVPADNWVYGYGNGQSKRDAADVTVVDRGLGEREVLWRSGETNGQFTWYDSVPWSNRVTLLPYAGREYLLLDEWDGTVYRSSNGRTWRPVAGTWLKDLWADRQWDAYGLGLQWTGDKYIACATLWKDRKSGMEAVGLKNDVLFLSEELELLSTDTFDSQVYAVGCQDGVYYVSAGGSIYRSIDGENWERTCVREIREAMVSTQ